jgi:exopolysaccharide biosynthesis polyprenyl glycosylphosphotransferase
MLDMILTTSALLLARGLRLALPYGKALNPGGVEMPWPVFVLVLVIWSFTLASFKVYDPQHLTHLQDELQTVITAIAVATLVFAGALYFSYRGLSRLLYVYFLGLDIAFCVVARLVLRRVAGSWLAAQHRRVLIIGAGSLGQGIARSLHPCAWLGIEVAGYLSQDAGQVGQTFEGACVLGTVEQATEVIRREQIHEVIIALPVEYQHELPDLVGRLQESPVNIKVVPDYSEMVFFRATLEQVGDVLLIGLKEPVIGPIDRMVKRVFDITVAALGLVLLAPLFAIIALLVALSSPGPVFYHSRRVGEAGRLFAMLKFRTMYQNADQQEESLITVTPDGRLLFDKRQDDPRVTPVGRFLRRYSLDELPQLFNVLVGEMSLVGPRPELPGLVEKYGPWQRKRLGVPQGITGWWQISGRGNKAKYLHIQDDLYYIQNYSLLLDLRIIWRTLGAVLKGEGAF